MAGKFNTLYLGEPADVVQALENCESISFNTPSSTDELRLALINAFSRIDKLEAEVRRLNGTTIPKRRRMR